MNANMTQGQIFNGTFYNNSLGVSLARFHTKALYLSSKMSPHFSNNIKVNLKTSIISKNYLSTSFFVRLVNPHWIILEFVKCHINHNVHNGVKFGYMKWLSVNGNIESKISIVLREPYNYFCFNPLYLFCKLGNYDILTRSLQFPSDKKGHFGGQKEHLIRKRDAGYHDGHHCESTGLEIFAFLLFLVYLLDFLRNILMNAMLNVMINDQTVTALQGKRTFLFNSK